MSLTRLIEHFSGRNDFPIKIDEIRDWLTTNGYQDEISFFPIDGDPAIMRGQFRQFRSHPGIYAEPKDTTYIYYPKTLNPCWERLVCVKEMMHIFDAPETRTAKAADIDALTLSLTSPLQKNVSASHKADSMAILSALQVLVPYSAIQKLRPLYETKIKSEYEIALLFRIPEFYIASLFSAQYASLYESANVTQVKTIQRNKAV